MTYSTFVYLIYAIGINVKAFELFYGKMHSFVQRSCQWLLEGVTWATAVIKLM